MGLRSEGRSSPYRVVPVLEWALLALFAVAPLLVADYIAVFASRLLILAMLAISFDLVFGYAGIMSFGQALFFGAGGYGVALLARDLGISSAFAALPAALLIGLALGWLVSAFLLLGRHPPSVIFVALGTLTASFAAEELARSWYYLGGQNGIPSIPVLTAGGYEFSDIPFYYLVLGLFVLVYAGSRALTRSQFGLALAGIREQEARIGFFGYRVEVFKVIIFAVAGAVAGLAGGLYAFHEGFVWPSILGVVLSTQIVLYCLFGGTGTLVGAILGVIAIEGLSYALSERFPTIWPVLLGVLLLLVILFLPGGIISLLVSERERVGDFGLLRRMARRGGRVPS
ncbi:MAG TPA: branched-chain amino acid ABC transporter permease [Acetobacteraceae bacterium]|jgi:branched-chain amino acid transport system permease protein|nr:branched-chain amino acid ABC transporter permease [Acetobacteraceae bacterium]